MELRPTPATARTGLNGGEDRRAKWIAPLALLILGVCGLSIVAQAERAPAAPTPRDASSVNTPVLSARRVPELLAAPVADRRLTDQLSELLSRAPENHCLTVSIDGRSVFTDHPDTPLIPASIEKLFTAEAAQSVLGNDAVLTTRAKVDDAAGDGTVNGNLWMVGGGDPLLMTDAYAQHFKHQPVVHSRLEDLADRIKDAGITHITGGVLGDDTHFDTQRYLPQWPSRFASLAEIGPMSALLVNDGLAAFPPSPDVHVPKETPADDAATHAADQLTQLLVVRGVAVDGAPGSGRAPDDAKEIAHLDSQPVGAIIAAMLTESDNGSAELLTKELGVRDSGTGSTAAGAAAVTKALRAENLPLDGTVQFDGSGLADDDRTTCTAVQTLLDRHGATSPFAASLPVAAQTGTLTDRFVDTPLAGRVHAKTGTLNQSTALAGYLDTYQGAHASFSFIMNTPAPQNIRQADVDLEEELTGIVAKYPETVDITKLEPLP